MTCTSRGVWTGGPRKARTSARRNGKRWLLVIPASRRPPCGGSRPDRVQEPERCGDRNDVPGGERAGRAGSGRRRRVLRRLTGGFVVLPKRWIRRQGVDHVPGFVNPAPCLACGNTSARAPPQAHGSVTDHELGIPHAAQTAVTQEVGQDSVDPRRPLPSVRTPMRTRAQGRAWPRRTLGWTTSARTRSRLRTGPGPVRRRGHRSTAWSAASPGPARAQRPIRGTAPSRARSRRRTDRAGRAGAGPR